MTRGRPAEYPAAVILHARDLACSGLNAGEIAKRTGLSRRYVKDLIEDTQRRLDARPLPPEVASALLALDEVIAAGEGAADARNLRDLALLLPWGLGE